MALKTYRLSVAISFALLLAAAPEPGRAQAGADLTQLEEVVVTARKRDESLQDVPLSISSFSADFIESAGLEDVGDLALQTPGFSFRQGFGRSGGGQGGASNRPSIRGMSNILGAANAAFFVDGVYVSGNITSYQLDNLERVEVIRGPQAALFGRQTFAGAINFITRKPSDETVGKVDLKIAQYDDYEASGYLSGPIVEGKLFAEVNARWYDFGGDYDNLATGDRDIGAQETKSVGAKLYWTPTDNFDLLFDVGYAEDDDGGYSYANFGSENLNCFEPVIVGAIFGFFPVGASRSRGYFCGEIEVPDQFSYRSDLLQAAGFNGVQRDAKRASLTMNWDIDDWTLSSITGYDRSENLNGFDLGLEPDAFTLSVGQSDFRALSQELRLATPQDRAVRGLAGVYYYNFESGGGFNSSMLVPDGMGGTRNFDPAQDGAGDVIRTPFSSADSVENRAIFGLVEWDATERLTLTAEARYQDEDITQGLNGNPDDIQSGSFDAFLPRITGRFAVNDDLNLYGSIAKGNKPGGFDGLPNDASAEDIAFFRQQGLGTFDEEEVISYEFGVKGTATNRALSYNAAVFYLDWTDQQLTESFGYQRVDGTPNTSPFIVNAGESEVKGLEVELNARPADWVDLRFTYAYVDAELTDFDDENTEDIFDTDGLTGADDLAGDPSGQVAGNSLPPNAGASANSIVNLHARLCGWHVGFFPRGSELRVRAIRPSAQSCQDGGVDLSEFASWYRARQLDHHTICGQCVGRRHAVGRDQIG